MTYEIKQWSDIAGGYEGANIILGNGASISIHGGFKYHSLREEAERIGEMPPELGQVFDYLGSDDFELVLRMLWHASKINSALGVGERKTDLAYQQVRDGLIRTVRGSHPGPLAIAREIDAAADFLKGFNLVVSLNYDLTVYWARMVGNNKNVEHAFKDCFVDGRFDDYWTKFHKPIGQQKFCTVVVYPHGNLALCRDIRGEEEKVKAGSEDRLVDAVLDRWASADYVPLFVSEGDAAQKRRSIGASKYLHTVFDQIIPSMEGSLVIYGWGMGEQDHHILDQIDFSKVQRVAVSVYQEDQDFCEHAFKALEARGVSEVEFFDAVSPGCWIYPEDEV